jgi:hypothetical protein
MYKPATETVCQHGIAYDLHWGGIKKKADIHQEFSEFHSI